MKSQAWWLSASVLAMSWSGTAVAQTAQAEAENNQEIVVTAERRATRLDRTPIAATVLSGEDLANAGVTVVDQLQFVAPATTVNFFGQGTNFNIRGIGKTETNSQTLTGVITYRDSVPSNPGWFTAEPYYDVRSIEILRGPQGTFVGANATGGAVFITSNQPVINGGTHGYVMAQAGNYNSLGGQGAVNIPISDTMAARVAVYADTRDSFYNITGPYSGDDGVQIFSGRFSLLWEPSSNLSLRWTTDLNYMDLSGYPSSPYNATTDVFDVTSNARIEGVDQFLRSGLRADYEFANGVTLRSVTSYMEGTTMTREDSDGTSVGVATGYNAVDDSIWSQEINLISPDAGPITWVLGAYYQGEDLNFPNGDFVYGTFSLQGHNYRENRAVFGQVNFDLPAGFELQVGARYSEHTTENVGSHTGYIAPYQQEAEFSNTSGKVTLNWTVDDNNFLYAFAATGFKPGGLSVPFNFLGFPPAFDEETVTSYELGWKAGFFDGRLRTQINGFYTEYENFQVTVRHPTVFPAFFNLLLNVPDTTVMSGFEAQAEALFGDLTVNAGFAVLNTELGSFYASDARVATPLTCDPLTGPASVTCFNLTGTEQTYAPELTFNIGVQYEFELPGGDTITPRVNFGHVGEQWATLFENKAFGDLLEARNIWNGQLEWRHDNLAVTLYGTNLSDQHYVAALRAGQRYGGAPRQYGIRLMQTF
jgi:iron complex outermembrane receptor protein